MWAISNRRGAERARQLEDQIAAVPRERREAVGIVRMIAAAAAPAARNLLDDHTRPRSLPRRCGREWPSGR